MEAYREPIERLLAAMERFVRDRSLRLLHVVASPDLRGPALKAVLAFEWHRANRSPFVCFEQGHSAARPGWDERADDARGQHERRRAANDSVPPLGDGALPVGRAAFASALLQLVHASPPGAEGLAVVLAPASLADVSQWLDALRPVVGDRRLEQARFVVVDPEPGPTQPLAQELGDRARTIHLAPDAAAKQRELDALLTALSGAGPIGASPRPTPPPHPARPPAIEPGPEAKLRAVVAQRVVVGSIAVRDGRVAEGVQQIREAREMCEQAGMFREAINLELVLGGQLASAGAFAQAEQTYARAIEKARARERHDQAATATFALGAVKLGRRDRHGAMVTLAEGTVEAEHSGLPALAIEGGRMTGQVAAELGMETQAIAFFTRAVKLAEAAGPQAPLTSGGDTARRLAAICEKRGLRAQAATFNAKAEQLEHLVVPEAPTVLPTTAIGEAIADEAPAPVAAVEPIVHAPVPVIFGRAATEDDEGTDLIAIEELAAMHWNVAPATEPPPSTPDPPAILTHGLSADQIESLRAATALVLDEDSTSMLTPAELAVLRGEAPLVVPPVLEKEPTRAPHAEPALGFDLAKIAALRGQAIEDEHDGGTRLHRRNPEKS